MVNLKNKLLLMMKSNTPTDLEKTGVRFKVRYTPENLLKCQLSYALKSVEVEDKFIVCELDTIQSKFVNTNQLKLNYIKKNILNTRI